MYTMSIIVFEAPMSSLRDLFFSYPLLQDEVPFIIALKLKSV